jgi:hypothetical protein
MGVLPTDQEREFTYYSENIEKHAKPNNTCEVYDIESYITNTHPLINEIKYRNLNENLNKELINLLDKLAEHKLITRGKIGYRVDDHKKQGFPRLMIHIKDEQLKQLAMQKHEFKYKSQQEFITDPDLSKWFDIINDIEVKDIQDDQPKKVAYVKILGDPNDHTDRVMMYGKNKQTLFAALKRQVKTAPVPDKQTVSEFINHSKKIIDKELGEELKDFGYDLSQWYNHLARAKQVQIKPIYEFYNHPERILDYTSKQIKEMLSLHYTAIVKAELQELDGKPRMVCAIPQHIKYIMGPVTWMLEEIATKHLRGYCGGLNLTEMGNQLNDYIKQGFNKVVEGDGSAFDNTQDVTLKSIDRYIYDKIVDKIYHVPKTLFRQVANAYYKVMDVNYRGKFDNKVRTYLQYYVLGTVFSGDCDTTLMNTIRMVLYNRFVNDKAGLIYGKDYIVYAKGDDFSVLYKNYITDDFIKKIYYDYFLPKSSGPEEITDKRQFGLGQILKYLDVGDPSTFKFCSLRSWFKDPLKEEITLTRDPSKLFNKALYSIKYKSYNGKQQYLYHIQQAISYITNYPGIDIFTIMAEAHFKRANEIRRTVYFKLDKKHKTIHNKIQEQLLLNKKDKKDEVEFTEDTFMNKILEKLFNVKQREKYIDFYTNYWEQVKLTEQVRTEVNSLLELVYINQQIQLEFSTEELKSLLALQ